MLNFYVIRFQKAMNWQRRDILGLENWGARYNYQWNYSYISRDLEHRLQSQEQSTVRKSTHTF